MDADVVVVGAGPVGLTAGLAMRALGRSVTILEEGAETRERPGSRAIFVHRESMEVLDRLQPGLGRRLVDAGLVWPVKRTTFRGREVFKRTYGPPKPGVIPQFSSLPQVDTERFLIAACRELGVTFEWSNPADDVVVVGDEVRVTTARGVRTAPYVIAADGSRSTVRKALGISMEGSRSEGHYIVVDVSEDAADPLPVERVFHYEHPGIGGRNVLIVPFRGGWRVDLQLHEGDDPEDFGSESGVRSWLPKVMPAKYADRLGWVSSYQFMQIVADRFTDDSHRVLLTGEAAHLFAPFGARGMNSGIADAEQAAYAIHIGLAASNAGLARHAVGEFARRRKEAAEFNRSAAGSALEHLRPTSRNRRKQWVAARSSRWWPRGGEWLERAPYGPRTGGAGSSGRY